jgi:hypothetical protein
LLRNATRSYGSALMGNSLPHQEHDISQERGPPCYDTALRNYHSSSQPILPCHGPSCRPIVALFVGRPGFDHRSVLVRFLVHQVALEQVFDRVLRFFVPVLRFSPVSAIPPMLRPSPTRCSNRKGKKRSLGTFQKAILSQIGQHWTEQKFHLVFKRLIRSIR